MSRRNVKAYKGNFRSDMMAFKAKGRASRAALIGRARSAPFRAGVRAGSAARFRASNQRTGGLLDLEPKFKDSIVSAAALTAPTDASGGEFDPATLLCLNAVGQGDTASDRDGMQIAMKSIEVEGFINCPAQADQVAGDVAPLIFIALVLDGQTNGAQLNSEDVFANPSGGTGLAACPLRNMSYTRRFKVLKKVVLKIPMSPITWDGTNIEQQGTHTKFKFFVNLAGCKVRYQTGTSTGYVGTITDNSLHIIAYTSSTSMGPLISYNARLRYVG